MFLFIACVLQNVESYRFLPILGQNYADVQNIVKYVFQHIFQIKTRQNKCHFQGSLSGPSRGYYLGQVAT